MGGPRQLVRIAGRFLIETIIRIDLSVSRKNVPMTSYMDTHIIHTYWPFGYDISAVAWYFWSRRHTAIFVQCPTSKDIFKTSLRRQKNGIFQHLCE